MNTETTLQRLVRKALTKRQHFNADGTPKDLGVGVTGVVVTIIILGILAAVGGPPLFAIIFDAREFKLDNNVQEAAQIVQQRLTLEPDWMGDKGVGSTTAADGQPTAALRTALVEDAAYTWESVWALSDSDDDTTIRLQFLNRSVSTATMNAAGHTTAGVAALAGAPPAVDWVSGDSRAVRLHARNSDGRWSCALIVVQANVDGGQAGTTGRYSGGSVPSGFAGAPAVGSEDERTNSRLMNAWLSGIWYDGGDVVTAGGGLHDCSPVDFDTTAIKASFPESANGWEIEDATATATDPVRTFARSPS